MSSECLSVRHWTFCCCCWRWRCCSTPDRRKGVVITGKQLGEGVNGVIYPAKLPSRDDIPARTQLAVKIAAPWSEDVMQTEGKFLQKLQGCIGIPRVFFNDLQKEVYFDSHRPSDFGMTGKIHWRRALVMERFSVDLKHWCNQKLTELTVRQLCYQLLNILQGVHKFGILHLDIKPENIMFKHKISPKDVKFKSPSEEQDIYLIDFGLAADLGEAEIARTLGDPSFRSRSQHVGNPQGRKDDLEIIANMALLLMGQEVVDQIGDSKVAAFADPPKDLPGWLSGFMRHIDAMDVGFAPENYDYERSFFFIAS